MKVLFADDKKTWHNLFDRVLVSRGIEVIHAYTPREALNKSVSENPDVVILDVTLSTGSGYEVLPNIAELGIPVILTGYSFEGFDRAKALKLGAFAALEKPFTVEELLGLLREIKGKGLGKEPEALELVVPEGGEMEVISLDESELPESLSVETLSLEEPEEVLEIKEPKPGGLRKEKLEEKVVREVKGELKELPLAQEKVEEIVREIAWEVIPEIAEKVIREEIERLIKSRLA